jgi:hypothetical protein
MVPSEEFLRYAVHCERMAASSRDPESKAVWSRLAERWVHCAEFAQAQVWSARNHAREKLDRKSVGASIH